MACPLSTITFKDYLFYFIPEVIGTASDFKV